MNTGISLKKDDYAKKSNKAVLNCKGKWGLDCNKECANCLHNEPCDIDTGNCPNDCKPGTRK